MDGPSEIFVECSFGTFGKPLSKYHLAAAEMRSLGGIRSKVDPKVKTGKPKFKVLFTPCLFNISLIR